MIVRRFFALLVALTMLIIAWGYWSAIADPEVREAQIGLPGWPAGTAPIRAVLLSDIHAAGPDMPPERIERIVAQVNALNPDLVLIAGDFVSDRRLSTRSYAMAEAIAPLAALRARLGVYAVPGNHDHWRNAGEARAALAAANVRLLVNQAARAGPLVIGGLDDPFTHRDNVPLTLARMRALSGPRILLSHGPDPFATLPGDIGLMLAGHTHCGQIRLPFYGALTTMSDYGERYACGWVRESGHDLIVTAGLGTSIAPLRLGAAPDIWVVTLGPRRR
jgi:predicted MPP superfamily phosphohydrolase